MPGARLGAATCRLGLAALCAVFFSACDQLRQWEQDRNAVAVGLSNPEVRHPIGFMARGESQAACDVGKSGPGIGHALLPYHPFTPASGYSTMNPNSPS